MSAENQNQNGVAPQSNGIKNPLSSISTTATMPAISATAGRTSSNNSSFLYSSNSMLNRDKMRQGPPPTLPKYTSSFNAGSNGTATDRLTRDRDVGGSYRLASLDRLALRQRVLQDGEKPNGDANSIQTKRELFFKGETTPPSVPSVPPPQPPSAPTVTPTATLTSSAPPPGAPAKSRLPPTTPTLNQTDGSEDSNKRENSRSESNKESNLSLHTRPTPPTKPKELDGYVGFANLPNQVYRKAVKKGFDFTLMVVGESGLGKSTLINSMFLSDIYSAEYPGPSLRVKKTVAVETSKVLLKENGVNLTLTVVDTPGFGDAVDNSNCWVPVIEYIESKYEEFLNAESRVVRRQIADSRVHCCLYFVAPSGHGLKPLDVEFMQRLHDKVNIIPVIAKADTMTPDECAMFKKQILNEIAQHKIKIYEFPETEDEEDSKLHKVLRDRVPFAVVGANTVVEQDGKKIRGRKYPWGVAEVENLEHCDFIALRNMVIRTHLQDLKDVTNNVHYENFRCRTLAGLGVDGKPTKVSNKNPLAQLEEEKREHDNKMKKMEIEMEQVFEMKVREKRQKLKDSEVDLQRRHEQMRRSFEQQVRELEEKRRAFESERQSWEQQTGHSIEELRRRSLEANSKETGSMSSEGSGGGGGTLRGSRGLVGSLLRRHTSFKSPQESPTHTLQHSRTDS
ncbi:septin-7 isoform X1 [Belonocnema kinseyi]|uniref:septin-7 isoform X1 n=1 Tax=Belonocnema kinseyi TaxID=2817044 RepID=UPI00143DA958|nr:septin-7 isoform X1 [Belonocnema kinseyi]XP_033216394.1 septin-7 isoform X1 [Belonocnema kinseyi]